jgi:hypothetical protein
VPTNDPLGGGGHVGGFINGTFMDYYTNVAATGNYRVAFRIATTQNGDRIQVKSMPTGTVLGTVTIPNTGSWSNWVTTELSAPIALTAGFQTIRLQFVSDNPEGANINWMDWDFTSEVTICNQTWMTKNLDVTTYRNGDPIPQVTDPAAWIGLTTGAWCYYNNDPAMGAAYGKLYNWYAVNDPRGLAPVGWNIAGGAMKSTSGWYENGNGTNSSGFSGFPGGFRANYSPAGFLNRSFGGYWWNSTAGYFVMFYNVSYITRGASPGVGNGFSVRCIRDITDGGSCIDVQAENFTAKVGGAFAQPGNDATDPLPSSPVMVGFTNGNWIDYNVTIPTAGSYAVSFRYATTQNSVKFQLYSGGVPVGGLISAPNTGGWSAFTTTAPVTISLTAGLQVIRVQVVANGSEGCNFNWFRFCAAGVPPVATVSKAPVLTDIVTSKLAVSVYPNPSDANFSLRVWGTSMDPVSIRIMDLSGRLVQKLQSTPGEVISFGENLKSGTYFVEVQQGLEKSVIKVVKN